MKAPAFQFYPDDFLGGVADMTQAEVGAYILLLCAQWGRGEIPLQADRVAMIAKGSVSEHVMAKFPGGRNQRMEQVRRKLEDFRRACSDAGRKGGGNPNLRSSKGTFKGRIKGGLNSPSPTPSPTLIPNAEIPLAAKPRARNELCDALARACGLDPFQMTPQDAESCAVAAAQIKKVCPEVNEAEFMRRARNYSLRFDNAALTPRALSKHWAGCDKSPPNRHQNAAPTDADHAQGF